MKDLLGKLGNRLDAGVKNLGTKGRELVEVTKLKLEIRDTEKSVDERFRRLGRKVFDMLNQGPVAEEELRTDAAEIEPLLQKIAALNETIRQVEAESANARQGVATPVCGSCGAANRAGGKFCSACGAKIP